MIKLLGALPEASVRGITLRGLKKLRKTLEQLVRGGTIFGTETDFTKISTSDIVYK